jgi:hypothetical protein
MLCGKCGARPAIRKSNGHHTWCRECRYEYDLWRWYRLTHEDFDALLIKQENRCAICAKSFSGRGTHVDHDHDCAHSDKGVQCCFRCVRGVLCGNCNHFAGWIETRLHLLAPALSYLGVEIRDAPD